MQDRPRTAVLLYGLLRSYRATAGSLLRHVVEPSAAAILYFGPAETDVPMRSHSGSFDERGFFRSNPKGEFEELSSVEVGDLGSVYGRALVRAKTHSVSQAYFRQLADRICPRREWLFMLSPHRLLSMFYNIAGVIALLEEHEQATGTTYDYIVLTRPDLAFFRPVVPKPRRREVHIADGEGLDENGAPRRGNAGVFYYKNVGNGDYLTLGPDSAFNDQLLVINRADLPCLASIYRDGVEALRNRVPASPETIFRLLLVERAGLRVVARRDWLHQIYRMNDAAIANVADTPAIVGIDPRHQLAERFLSLEERDRLHRQPGEVVMPTPQEDDRGERPAEIAIDHERAQADLSVRLLASNPGLWRRLRGWNALRAARRHARQGQWPAAIARYRDVLYLLPHRYRLWIQLGHALRHEGQLRAAAGAYETALTLHPGDIDATANRDAVRRSLAT